MQGQAFLVTFCAIAKSDWPRAAMERAGGKPTNSAKNELGWYQFAVGYEPTLRDEEPLTLTLSRGGTGLRRTSRG